MAKASKTELMKKDQGMSHKQAANRQELSDLPKPRTAGAGSVRLVLTAILALAILACAGYWLTRTEAEKVDLRVRAADIVSEWLDGTPFARLADYLRPAPEPLPQAVIHPLTAPGTLAGRNVTATVAAPMEFGADKSQGQLELVPNQAEASADSPQIFFDQEPVEPVKEDSRVKAGYVEGLARWLAAAYKPGGGLNISLQALNQEGGGRLAGEAAGGRSGLLRYAFHPAMISGLYNLYIGRFMQELDAAAKRKGLDAAQNRQFHRAVGGRAALMASALYGVLRVENLPAKLASIDSLAQKAVDCNTDLTTAVFELDELRDRKADKQAIATGQMRVDGANARYRRATDDLASANSALANEIRRYSGQNMDEETLLFLAAWVGRRYAQGSHARGSIESCIAALRDLSARCARFGEDT